MHGRATHLISDDCEILMKVDGGQQIIHRLVRLKHLEGCVRLVYKEAYVNLGPRYGNHLISIEVAHMESLDWQA